MNRRQRNRSGFTLTEVLIVIGIMITLMGILMPAIGRAYKEAQRARISTDIQAIVVGLEAYKSQFGDYPPPPDTSVIRFGSVMLCRSLIAPGPEAEDGADGPGFRVLKKINGVNQGKPFGPYLELDKIKYSTGANPSISDRYGKAILYFPRQKNAGPTVVVSNNPADKPAYLLQATDNTELTVRQLRSLLNVDLSTGQRVPATGAAPARSVAYEGPFLLISPGPDGLYGPQSDDFISSKNRCDDVTNWSRTEY